VSCLMVVYSQAQPRTGGATTGTGSISGRVTAGGNPLPGVSVGLQPSAGGGFGPSIRQSTLRAQTDADGRYKFTDLAAGNYQISTFSPLYAQAEDPTFMPARQITLNDGESLVDIDLQLIRGGVVTGKITDSDGRPLIEQYIQFDRLDAQNNTMPYRPPASGLLQTDDRGIYRAYGVKPGRYRVSAGEGNGAMFRSYGRRTYPRTFHPDAADAQRATIIEVREGSELTGIDIKLGLPPNSYAIVGRAVDADTGEPVANLNINCTSIAPDGRMSMPAGRNVSGANGEFRIDNIGGGRYNLVAGSDYATPTSNSGYSDPLMVEVQGGDVTGIELRIKRGSSMTGMVVLEGAADPSVQARLEQQRIMVFVMNEGGAPSIPSAQQLKIGPNGSFRVDGVRPGKVMLSHQSERNANGSFSLLRIERDGVGQSGGIVIGPGEQVTGIKVVFGYGNGVIRGQVIVIGGIPAGAMCFIIPRRADAPRQDMMSMPARTDTRGYFLMEGLAPGQYELEAQVFTPGPPLPNQRRRPPTGKQSVTVTNGQVTEVTITIDPSKETPDRER
jgi:protocatechuate 3,4-dioxygenase beta subunit